METQPIHCINNLNMRIEYIPASHYEILEKSADPDLLVSPTSIWENSPPDFDVLLMRSTNNLTWFGILLDVESNNFE